MIYIVLCENIHISLAIWSQPITAAPLYKFINVNAGLVEGMLNTYFQNTIRVFVAIFFGVLVKFAVGRNQNVAEGHIIIVFVSYRHALFFEVLMPLNEFGELCIRKLQLIVDMIIFAFNF